jgi:hypothetical protein
MSSTAWYLSSLATTPAQRRRRMYACLTIAVAACCTATSYAYAADPQISVQIKDLVLDYSWGYSTGIKQHQGSFKNGRSVHAVSRFTRVNPNPNLEDLGNPDWLMWVDETTGEASTHEHPVGIFGDGINPGGNVTFGTDVPASDTGYMWWVLGARAETLPFDLARSVAPFDPRTFDVVLNDFETVDKSTAVTMGIKGQTAMMVYRYLRSTSPVGKVLFKRFDLQPGTPQLELVRELGWAGTVAGMGDVTIEQVWTRWDPRRGAYAATWQWFARDILANGDVIKYFGSNPFIYTEDFGETWRLADGSLATLPLQYATNNSTISPYDHLAAKQSTLWFTRDVGFTPNGTPWMSIPAGPDQDMRFFFWSESAWQSRTLTNDLEGGDPVACGTTKNYVVCLFSERARPGVLLARTSGDNGATWSAPQAVDTIPRTPQDALQKIAWVSFVQPSDGYPDDVARFFYGYWDTDDAAYGRDYGNNMRWIRLEIDTENANPTIDIVSPIDVSSQVAGTPIPLDANTSDPDGDTVTVSWTANGNPIAEPWTPPAGNYTVVATASDGNGGSATDSVSITVTANGSGTLPATVAAVGINAGTASRLIDTQSGSQNLSTSWSNNGVNSTAWFTLDLGSSRTVERLRMAPRGGLTYVFTVTIGNTLSGGKASGPANGTCSIRGANVVPTTLDLCAVSGVGRYVTVQGSRPWLIMHGIEVVGSAPPPTHVLPAIIHDAGSNDATAPRIVDVLNGAQNLSTSWTNDGTNSTAWFTLDLGSQVAVGRLMVAPRGGVKYTLTITIGNTVSGGKVSGSAAGSCVITGPTITPTSLTPCAVSGSGRYVTVQGSRPYLVFHGIEAWKP